MYWLEEGISPLNQLMFYEVTDILEEPTAFIFEVNFELHISQVY
jgi:hypothetical protein